jgi:hypothetical protein
MVDIFGDGRVKASIVEQATYDDALGASRVSDIPSNLQQRIDYGERTDGQPTYVGFADKGLGISASGWLLQKFTYTSDLLTYRSIAYDSWDDRSLSSYE